MGGKAWAIEINDDDKQRQEKEWERQCIYKLPNCVTGLNKNNAYKPRAVSFGPYHHGDPDLKVLEDHKHRVHLHFLKRSEKPLQDYFDELKTAVQDLMGAYDSLDPFWWQNEDEFLQLMIRDGCFMLEILRTFTQSKNDANGYARNDPIFSNHGKLYMMPYMKRDMLMLENQLPLLVLEKLHAVQNPETKEDREIINRLVLKFCFPQFSENINKMQFGKCLHVLDVLRKGSLQKGLFWKPPGHNKIGTIFGCCRGIGGVDSSAGGIGGVSNGGGVGSDPVGSGNADAGSSAGGIRARNSGGDEATKLPETSIQMKKNKTRSLKDIIICAGSRVCGGGNNGKDEIIRSATELYEAGIRFKKSKTDSLNDITFQKGILRLPSIVVDDITEPMFLNLIAFERFHVGAGNDVTAYIFFMDNIIDEAKDVSLLHSCGIIQNAIGSDKAAAKLFNSLSTDVTLDPDGSLGRVHRDVNKYCKQSWNQWRANLSHTYFQSPWASLSVIAAIFLFALTIVQTIYTVGQYYQS